MLCKVAGFWLFLRLEMKCSNPCVLWRAGRGSVVGWGGEAASSLVYLWAPAECQLCPRSWGSRHGPKRCRFRRASWRKEHVTRVPGGSLAGRVSRQTVLAGFSSDFCQLVVLRGRTWCGRTWQRVSWALRGEGAVLAGPRGGVTSRQPPSLLLVKRLGELGGTRVVNNPGGERHPIC